MYLYFKKVLSRGCSIILFASVAWTLRAEPVSDGAAPDPSAHPDLPVQTIAAASSTDPSDAPIAPSPTHTGSSSMTAPTDSAGSPADAPAPGSVPAADSSIHPQPVPAPAGPSADMLNLLDLLVQKNVITQDDAAQLQKKAHERSLAQAAAAQAAPAPAAAPAANQDISHVTYVPAIVRDQIRDELKDEVMNQAREENWANPRELPNWLSRISFFGDVRVRTEGDFFPSDNATGVNSSFWNMNAINTGAPIDYKGWLNGTVPNPSLYNANADRDRIRLRARFGLDADLGEGFSAGFRIATGQDDSPVSENQSLGYSNNGQGGNFSKYAIWVDRAFVKYDFWTVPGKQGQPDKGLSFTAGRFDNPFFSTTMIWADDLGFDGFVAKAKYEVTDGVTPFLTVGAFPVYNTDFNFSSDNASKFSSEDKWLYGVQVGTDWKINDNFSLKVAAAFYDFQNIEGQVSSPYTPLNSSAGGDTDDSRPGFAQRGNTYIALRDIVPNDSNDYGQINQWQYFGLATAFREVALTERLDYNGFDPFHLWLIGEAVKNVAFDRTAIENNGPPQLLGPVNNIGGNGTFDGGDTGWILSLNVGSPVLQKRWDWNAGVSYRYVESDAVVDGLCDSDFGGGGTNLKGYVLGGNLALASRVWLGLRWMSADSIAGPNFKEDLVMFDINAKF